MNIIKSLTAAREKREATRVARRTLIDDLLAQGLSHAEVFSKLILRDAVEEALDATDYGRNAARWITKGALICSLPHQIGYFLFMVTDLHFGSSLLTWLHPMSVLFIALIVPVLIDGTILLTVRKLTTKLLSLGTKIAASVVLTIVALLSAWINFTAPAPSPELAQAAGIAILFVPASQLLVAFSRVSPKGMTKLEKKVKAQLPPTPVVKAPRHVVTPAEKRARARDKYADMSAYGQKQWRQRWAAKHPQTVEDTFDTARDAAREAVNA